MNSQGMTEFMDGSGITITVILVVAIRRHPIVSAQILIGTSLLLRRA
jgi:hypothetical protein